MDSQQLEIRRARFLKKHWIEPDKTDESPKTALLSVMSVPNECDSKKNTIDLTFLDLTPFTERMIKDGLRRWKQPFDEFDLRQIETGELSAEDAIKYLYWWIDNNRDRYNELKQELEPDYRATCGECQHFKRIDHPIFGRHRNLGHCAAGEPEALAGLWDETPRWCKSFERQDV